MFVTPLGPPAEAYVKHANHLGLFGIVIRMFYKEHEPPHFHAEHQGQQAKVGFDGELLVGNLQSATAGRLIHEWASLHRHELEANWENMKAGRPLERIAPLQ